MIILQNNLLEEASVDRDTDSVASSIVASESTESTQSELNPTPAESFSPTLPLPIPRAPRIQVDLLPPSVGHVSSVVVSVSVLVDSVVVLDVSSVVVSVSVLVDSVCVLDASSVVVSISVLVDSVCVLF